MRKNAATGVIPGNRSNSGRRVPFAIFNDRPSTVSQQFMQFSYGRETRQVSPSPSSFILSGHLSKSCSAKQRAVRRTDAIRSLVHEHPSGSSRETLRRQFRLAITFATRSLPPIIFLAEMLNDRGDLCTLDLNDFFIVGSQKPYLCTICITVT